MGLGLLLGSAAKSGLETYERLNAEERKQKAQTRMDEIQRREDEKYAREEAIRVAAGEVEGTGASQPVTLRHSDGRAETHKLAPEAAGGFAQAWSDYYAREGAAAEQAAARTKAISGRRDKLPTDMPGLEPVAPRVDVTAPPGEVELGAVQRRTAADVMRDTADRVRQFDPVESMRLLERAGAADATALQMRAGERTERYSANEEKVTALTAMLPLIKDDPAARRVFARQAASLATQLQDNGAAGWSVKLEEAQDGKFWVRMQNPQTGALQYKEMEPEAIVKHLQRFATPAERRAAEARDREDTRFAKTDAQKDRELDINDLWRRGQLHLGEQELGIKREGLGIDRLRANAAIRNADPAGYFLSTPAGKKLQAEHETAKAELVAAMERGDAKAAGIARTKLELTQTAFANHLGRADLTGMRSGAGVGDDVRQKIWLDAYKTSGDAASADAALSAYEKKFGAASYDALGQGLPPKPASAAGAATTRPPLPFGVERRGPDVQTGERGVIDRRALEALRQRDPAAYERLREEELLRQRDEHRYFPPVAP